MYLPCSRSLLSISVIVLPRSETAGSQRARLRKGQDRRDRRATTESREKTLETHNPAAGLQADPERPRPLVTSSDATPVLPRAAPNLGRAPERGRAETQAPAVRFTLPGAFRLCLLGGALQNWSRCLIPCHSGRPGTARWTPRPDFPCLHREERCSLQVRPRILAGLAGASGLGLGVRRPFPP